MGSTWIGMCRRVICSARSIASSTWMACGNTFGLSTTMIERAHDRLALWPERLVADTGYGSAEMLNWLVHERGIEPHIPVFDKSKRKDGTFSRSDFTHDRNADAYTCPAGKPLRQRRKTYRTPVPLVDEDGMMRYRASKLDCEACVLKPVGSGSSVRRDGPDRPSCQRSSASRIVSTSLEGDGATARMRAPSANL